MVKNAFLRVVVSGLLFAASIGVFSNLQAQTCDGADGLFPPLSGNTVIANGDICANAAIVPYRWEVTYTNVDDNATPANVEFFIDWNDGTTQVVPIGAGDDFVQQTGANAYRAVVTHFFPPNGADVKCEYIPEVSLRINGAICPSTVQNPSPVVRWNTDDELTGILELSEEVTSNVVFEVCAGETATVRFVDRSEFNCVPANFPGFPPNVRTRWFQFIYGGDPINNTITGSGITINTNTGSNPEGAGLINLPAGATYTSQVVERTQPIDAPTEFTFDITVPADAQIGEEFAITLNNWNACNPYSSGGVPTGIDPTQFSGLIRIIDSPPPPAYTPQEYCVGEPNILTVASSNGGAITWYSDPALTNIISLGPTLNAQTDPPTIARVDNSVAGIHTFYATETLGNNCEGPAAAVTFQIFDNPTSANAGSDQTVCSDITSLSANNPMVGTGQWSVISGPGTVNNPNLFNSAVSNLTGNTVLEWKTVNGICEDADLVIIYRDTPPDAANAGTNQVLCAETYVLQANTPISGTGQWSVTSGNASFSDTTDPNAVVSDLDNGPNILRWTISNTCGADFDEITIVNNMPGPANAGLDQSVCSNITQLNADAPVVGNGSWSVLSGDGLENINNPSLRNSDFQGTPGVVYELLWTVSNGVCNDNSDAVIIEFIENPTVSQAGADQIICGNSTPLTANSPVIGLGNWSEITGDGLGQFADNSDPQSVFTGTPGVVYQLQWTITNGSCTPSESQVTIQFDETPTLAQAGSDQVICGSTITLAANTPTVGTGVWTETSGDGNGVFSNANDPNTEFTGTEGVIYQLQWAISNGSCPTSSDMVQIQLDPGPDNANAGPDLVICGNSAQLDANIPVTGNGEWSVVAGDAFGTFNDKFDAKSTFSGTSGTDYQLKWTISSGTCVPSEGLVNIQFDETPTIAQAGSAQVVCGGSANLNANYPVIGTGLWTVENNPDGAGSLVEPTDPKTIFSGTEGQNYVLRWTISNGSCNPSFEDISIQLDEPATMPNAGPDQNVCLAQSTNLNAEIPLVGSGNWIIVSNPDGNGQISDPINASALFSGSYDQEYVLRWVVSNGVCAPQYDEVTIKFGPDFQPISIAGPEESCIGDIINLTIPGADAAKYNYLWDVSELPVSVNIVPGSGKPFQFISIQASESFTGNVKVIAEDKVTGCLGPENIKTITVLQSPDIVLTSNDPDQFICENQEVIYTATDLNGVANRFDFILNGSIVQSSASNTYTTNILSVGNSMRVIGYNGNCASNPSQPLVHTVSKNPVAFNVLGGGEICEGDSGAEIRLNNSLSGENYELYLNDVPTGQVVAGGGQISFGPQNQPGEYTVYAINGNSCTVKMKDSAVISINTPPEITLYGEDIICGGSDALLIFESIGTAPFTIDYLEGNTPKTIAGASDIHPLLVSPQQTTNFTITGITDANGCSTIPVNETIEVIVISPQAEITTNGPLTGCTPFEFEFENRNIAPNTTYEWIWGDGTPKTVSAAARVPHIFENGSNTVARTYTVTLNAIYDDGNMYCANSQSIEVTVFPAVVPDVQPDRLSGCSPMNISFSNRSKGAQAHQWYYKRKGVNEQLGNTNERAPGFALVNSGNRPVVYEIIYEASNSDCADVQITEIEVYPEVNAEFTINGSANPANVMITNPSHASIGVGVGNNPGWTYLWDYGDGNTSTGYQPLSPYKYEIPGSYTVSLTVIEPDGNCSNDYSVSLRVDAVIPVLDFEATPLSGCRPLKVQFTNKSFSVEPSTFLWEFINEEGQVVGTSNLENPEFTFYDAGLYTVRLSGKNNLGTEGFKEKSAYIEVFGIPTAVFLIRPDKVFIPGGILYTQNLSINATDFIWDFGDGATSNLYSPEHEYTRTGTYSVKLTAINSQGCMDSLTMENVVEVLEGGTLKVPNAFTPSLNGPTGGVAGAGTHNDVFKPIVEGATEFEMLIFDRWGNLIFVSNDSEIGWDGYDKHGRLLPTGVYVYKMRLKFGNNEYLEKIGDVTLLR